MRFFITGARAPAALQLTRILGRSGHEVILADSVAHAVAYRSRWVLSHEVLPPPANAYRRFAEAAAKAIARHSPDVVLCTCEEIFYWAKAAEQDPQTFASWFRANPPFATLRLLHHKGAFARVARASARTSGVRIPTTCQTQLASDGPWVCKPAYSRFAVMTRLGLSSSEAQAQLAQPGWVAQEQISGDEFCTWGFYVAGAEVCFTAYRPLYRAGRGSGIGLRGIEAPRAREFARHLAARLGYTGQLAFDWIAANGEDYLLECNPRSTSGVHFLDGQTAATAEAITNAIAGQPFTPVVGALEEVAVKWAMLLFGAGRMLLPHGGKEEREFFNRARDTDSDSEDRAPTELPAILTAFTEIAGRAIRNRCGLLSASTQDIEWNGDRFWANA